MEVPVEYEVAVFPLSRVDLDPPMFVQAVKSRGECRKGQKYYLTAIYKDGRVSVMAGRELHPMENFVQLLNRTVLSPEPRMPLETGPSDTKSNSTATPTSSSSSKTGGDASDAPKRSARS